MESKITFNCYRLLVQSMESATSLDGKQPTMTTRRGVIGAGTAPMALPLWGTAPMPLLYTKPCTC